jgi:4-amino-4-deoxy-L-arabinose transferase-like glycosyltransferase
VTATFARRRSNQLVALGLFLATAGWLLAVEGRQGISRDEAQYFRSAERYWGWFEELAGNLAAGRPGQSFSRAGIDRYWSDNPEHPVVMKTLYGFSWRLFHRCECVKEARWHYLPVTGKHRTVPIFARESTAFRLPAILLAGLGAVLVFWLALGWVGTIAAAVAAVLAVAQPHYFFHAQVAAFDAPITVMAVALGLCYWRSLRAARPWRAAILAGVVFGVALGVKHNAWLMPIFLVGHYLWMRRYDLLRRRRPPPVPLVFLGMLLLGPLVFYLHWPRVWANPVGHTTWYVKRHLEHEHYNFEYLDRNWNNPPKQLDRQLVRATFPFVSAAVTVPVTTLALAGLGGLLLLRRARRSRREQDDQTLLPDAEPIDARPSWLRPGMDVDRAPGAFLLVQILGPMAVIAVPETPIFGGVKHFMPAMPYLAVVAAIGLRWLTRAGGDLLASWSPATDKAQRRLTRLRSALPLALAAVVTVPALVETRRSHPDGLSHYNMLAGGFAGGASLGMNRQFWGYSVMPLLPWVVANAPASNAIYWHDVFPDALNYYVRDGRLPPGLGNVGSNPDDVVRSDLGLVIHERHFLLFEGLFWEAYRSPATAQVRTREGVPLVTAYRRWNLPK